jgi:hypothetical protein
MALSSRSSARERPAISSACHEPLDMSLGARAFANPSRHPNNPNTSNHPNPNNPCSPHGRKEGKEGTTNTAKTTTIIPPIDLTGLSDNEDGANDAGDDVKANIFPPSGLASSVSSEKSQLITVCVGSNDDAEHGSCPALCGTDDESSSDDEGYDAWRQASRQPPQPVIRQKRKQPGVSDDESVDIDVAGGDMSQDDETEEDEECIASALGEGYYPIPEAKDVHKGESLGEGAQVYASAKRFATNKEAQQILASIDEALVSTRTACFEKGYTQIVYAMQTFADLRNNPLDGMMTGYWQKFYSKGQSKKKARAQGKMFKLYITNRTTMPHEQFQKRQSNQKQSCRCIECREGRTAIEPFRGRITAFQTDITNNTGYVLFEFMGDDKDVFIKATGSKKLSDKGRARTEKTARSHKPTVGAARQNAETLNKNLPLNENVSRRQVSSTGNLSLSAT